MKTSICVLTIPLFMVYSCTKPSKTTTPAMPGVAFQILDKSGEALITSLKDSVTLSYYDNNANKKFTEPILGINLPSTYTAQISKYNGVMASDEYTMILLSNRSVNPINTFNLNLNGKSLGVIYFDYAAYEKALTLSSSPAFTFNGTQVKADITGGIHLNLIQL